VKPAPFDYDAPTTPDEAVAVLAEHGDAAKVLAGGQSLIPMLSLRLTFFDRLVDIGRIDAMRGIERRGDTLWIGAGTTDAEVERSAEVASAAPLVARATPLIGHLQIRNRGTVGGSIAHADPAAEYPAVALALDASLDVLSPRGARTVAASDFFTGVWSTSLEADELLVGVSFPVWSGRCGFAVEEYARRHGDYAIAGAAVAVELDGDDTVSRCAIGLIGMSATPLRATGAEAMAVGSAADAVGGDELGRVAATEAEDVPSDLHGSAGYRRRVCAAVVSRAWSRAVEEARGG
jgi:aerobic carbon-monoxide dehydrogenase medium subunit